ncbi:MAG: glutathione S-transferase family protein [Calothrix sp. C42_A2020_038]|nr:glutathione S-transferase family protein [Calothrix sp. C42_A2020_038]
METLRLFDFLPSANGYKIRLLLTQLGIPFERINFDITKNETRSPDFLSKNPNGQIPVLEVQPGQYLAESNAILIYLSEGTEYLPYDRWQRAQVIQWLFFEQCNYAYIATPRLWISILHQYDQHRTEIEKLYQHGYTALQIMENHLQTNNFFVGGRYSIADISLFAHTHVAPEGGYDLTQFPAIGTWIERIKSQPGYIDITEE